MRLNSDLRTCLKIEHLRRTGLISLVVGTWLTLFNLGGLLLAEDVSFLLLGKIFLNYLTPFVVANAGLLSREGGRSSDRS